MPTPRKPFGKKPGPRPVGGRPAGPGGPPRGKPARSGPGGDRRPISGKTGLPYGGSNTTPRNAPPGAPRSGPGGPARGPRPGPGGPAFAPRTGPGGPPRGDRASSGPARPARDFRPASRPPRAGGRVDFGPRDTDRTERIPIPEGFVAPHVRIVHEDEHVIVIDKPPGLISAAQPGETRVTLMDLVKRYLRTSTGRARPRKEQRELHELGRSEKQRLGVIHRLDKEASGLMVFSKTDTAFGVLKEDFKSKRVHRIYLALVEGEMGVVGDQGTIQSFLRELPNGHVESIAPDEFRGHATGPMGEGEGKLAVTHYRVLGVGSGMTLVQVRLETGRKNQIRVHFAGRGHPLVGDPRNGSKTDPLGRLGLHASELGFAHPGTGVKERYSSPAPAGFYHAVGLSVPESSSKMEAVRKPLTSVKAPGFVPAQVRDEPGDTSWEAVAPWYDQLQNEGRSDHYTKVIVPGVLRLIEPGEGVRILDVACGQGHIAERLASLGASVTGVDASAALIKAATARRIERCEFLTGDARNLDALSLPGAYDRAISVMALSNIDPLEPVFRAVSSLLRPGGTFTLIVSHPAFRAPGQTHWGWDDKTKTQFRRVDGYLSPGQHQITMHPGKLAAGEGSPVTWTFHRPLQTYARLLSEAGLLIETLEEWPGQRESTSGPRANEENRARREIPLFLAVRAVKR